MPQKYTDVLEVLIGQMAESRDINPVLGKTLRVLGHAELFKPLRNLRHCGYTSQAIHEAGNSSTGVRADLILAPTAFIAVFV